MTAVSPRHGASCGTLAGQLAGEPLETAQMIAVVSQRDLEVAIDRQLAVPLVPAGQPRPLADVKALHVSDETRARLRPLVEGVLELDAAEVGTVVREQFEARILAGRDGSDPGLVAVALGRRQVRRDVAQGPRTDPHGGVLGVEPQHGGHDLLAVDELIEDVVAHSGFMSLERGLAAVNSSITAATTSCGTPGRSSIGPHFQPSR